MLRGAIIICILYLTVEIKARCNMKEEKIIVDLNEKFTQLVYDFNRLDSAYDEHVENKRISETFASDVYESILSRFHVPLTLSTKKYAYCQALVKSEIEQTVRTNEIWHNFMLLEKKISFLVKRRSEMTTRAVEAFKEIKILLQNLESQACQNRQIFMHDADIINMHLNYFEKDFVHSYEEVINSSITERQLAIKETEKLSENIDAFIINLKSRRDIHECIAPRNQKSSM